MTSFHPVDHGWAWVICFATGVQAFFVVGGLKAMGIIFVDVVEKFEAPPSLASLLLGLVAAGFSTFALLSTAAAVKCGHRNVSLFGTVLLVVCTLVNIWAMNIYYVIVFMGLMSGLAFGAMATPAVILLNFYFDEKKSLANGLAMVGSSIGQLSVPYLMTYLLEEYGFRGAMLLYTGICMQSIPAAMLLWPTSFWVPKKKGTNVEESPDSNNDTKVADLDRSHISLHSNASRSDYTPRMSLHGSRSSLRPCKLSTIHNSTGSIMLGMSVENIAETIDNAVNNDERSKGGQETKTPNFCQVLFDHDLMVSLTMWMLFLAIGIGHAGFINCCLYVPSLSYDLFGSKYVGAQLIMIMGFFDIAGRVGGGLIADTGILKRTNLTGLAMSITGSATILSMFYPVFGVLVAYSVIMGLVGGVYRILSPVIVADLFGKSKISSGVGLVYLSMGVFMLPMPSLLGSMKEDYGSYVPALMLCGAILLFGGILMFFMPLFKQFDENHNPHYPTPTRTEAEPELEENKEGSVREDQGAPLQPGADDTIVKKDDMMDNEPTEMTEADIADIKM